MSEETKNRPTSPPPKSGSVEKNTPAHWAKECGVDEAKLAGICAWTGWIPNESQVTEAEFKRLSKKWLNHAPGSGKRPKEVGV